MPYRLFNPDTDKQLNPHRYFVECPECGGDGELATSHRFTCYECKGSGWVTPERNKEINDSYKKEYTHYTCYTV